MTKTIIFDIGGVVVFIDFNALYTNFANRTGINPEWVKKYNQTNRSDLLCGIINLDRSFSDMRQEATEKQADLQAIWLEEALKLRRPNTELLEVIVGFRKKYTVGALTNLSPTRKMVDEATELYKNFDYAVLSCDVGLKKPDVKIFQLALDKAGVKPEEAIFVDDNPKRIDGAEELGIPTIIYKDNANFLKQLLGILDAETAIQNLVK